MTAEEQNSTTVFIRIAGAGSLFVPRWKIENAN
jgi:hypothetical protein